MIAAASPSLCRVPASSISPKKVAPHVCARRSPAPGAAPGRYGATIFLSAALLFAVQPMFTKMVLPRLGGSPAVWSVAMVFFQALLLAGYAYAHLLTRCAPGRSRVMVQVGVMVGARASAAAGIATRLGPAAAKPARRSG